MITEIFIRLLGGIVTAFFSIIPTWGVDASSIQSINTTVIGVGSLNNWFPEQLVIGASLTVLAVRLFMFAWELVLFCYRLLPFNG